MSLRDATKDTLRQLKEARLGETSRIQQEKSKMYEVEDSKNMGSANNDDSDGMNEFIVDDDNGKKYHEYEDSEDEIDNKNKKKMTKMIGDMKNKPIKEVKITSKMRKKADEALGDIFGELDDEDYTVRKKVDISNNKISRGSTHGTQDKHKFNDNIKYGSLNPNIAPNFYTKDFNKDLKSDEAMIQQILNNTTKFSNTESDMVIDDFIPEKQASQIGKDRVISEFVKNKELFDNSNSKRMSKKVIDDDEGPNDQIGNSRVVSDVKKNTFQNDQDTFGRVRTEITPMKPISNINTDNSYPNKGPVSHTPKTSSLAQSSLNQDSGLSLRGVSRDPLPSNQDGSLQFYWYDAHEESSSKNDTEPKVVLFGKIQEKDKFSSISVVIKNLQRTIFLFPKLKTDNTYYDTFEIFQEFDTLRKSKFSYIDNFISKEVTKNYAFELPIPHQEHSVLKIKYDAKFGFIPENLQGNTFSYIFGKKTSLLESVILKLKMKGPSWINIQPEKYSATTNAITWSKFEINVTDFKALKVISDNTCSPPPFKILSLATKSAIIHDAKEIINVCGVVKANYYLDREDNDAELTKDTTAIILSRKLKNFDPDLLEFKTKFGCDGVIYASSENNMLSMLIQKISAIDPDIIVGHEIYSNHIDLLLTSFSKYKIKNWSLIGKMKRDIFPKFLQSNNSAYVRTSLVGRLLCDTFLSCRDILKETNYNIDYLAPKYLEIKHEEMDATNLVDQLTTKNINDTLYDLTRHSLDESLLSLKLMHKMKILQLSKQLTNIAGNLWIKSLQNSRADRCEWLLMHDFVSSNYLIPDKQTKLEKVEEYNEDAFDDGEEKGNKRKPQYGGGKVLEPKTGLYDSIILLLDFNSLYPSIIREYKICFTTVKRNATENFIDNRKEKRGATGKKGKAPKLPDEEASENHIQENVEEVLDFNCINKDIPHPILPKIVTDLIGARKRAKDRLKLEKNINKKANLEIEQKALKLSANSLYGYLGYKNSRFYSKAIAALITSTGRKILDKTVELVQTKHSLEVIYGDTDSIMINSLTSNVAAALELGNKVKRSVNNSYNLLEMEVDGIFKTLLLLKKKKYAAVKYEAPYEEPFKTVTEYKGLDLVRRDWCELSKQVGLYILETILNIKGSKEETIMKILEFLREVAMNMETNKYGIDTYAIIKQITKKIEDYGDAKSLPHVKVAKRLLDQGDSSIKAHVYIPYIICKQSVNAVQPSKSLADRAYHLKEVIRDSLKPDLMWYKENQILASVSRLCKHIKEMDMFQIANCLGIDSRKYESINKIEEADTNATMYYSNSALVCGIAKNPIKLTCPSCNKERLVGKVTDSTKVNFESILHCEDCKNYNTDYNFLLNQVILNTKMALGSYYQLRQHCGKCDTRTRLIITSEECKEGNCRRGRYKFEIQEHDVANDLNFQAKLFDSHSSETRNDGSLLSNYGEMQMIHNFAENIKNTISYNSIDFRAILSGINL